MINIVQGLGYSGNPDLGRLRSAMVKKIKKRVKASPTTGPSPGWLVAFDAGGQAAVYVHAHGDSDDHSQCGPVVMCCERARLSFERVSPDQCLRVVRWAAQEANHLETWFRKGLSTMYFALCDVDDDTCVYSFGLPRDHALLLLNNRVDHDQFRTPEHRFPPLDAP